jgi:hypothetical protein
MLVCGTVHDPFTRAVFALAGASQCLLSMYRSWAVGSALATQESLMKSVSCNHSVWLPTGTTHIAQPGCPIAGSVSPWSHPPLRFLPLYRTGDHRAQTTRHPRTCSRTSVLPADQGLAKEWVAGRFMHRYAARQPLSSCTHVVMCYGAPEPCYMGTTWWASGQMGRQCVRSAMPRDCGF